MAIIKAVETMTSIEDLKQSRQWVNWKRDPQRGKIPVNPKTGGNAMSNNPGTWADYSLAERQAAKYDGIGFMFAHGVCGIDIDGFDSDPERIARAQDIIQLMDTYTEYSPSGTGYHIIFRCDVSLLPRDYKNLFYQKNQSIGVECYISGMTNRFFTYTGEAISGYDIEDRTPELLTFLDRYMKKPTSGAVPDKPTQTLGAANPSVRISGYKTDADYLNDGLRYDRMLADYWNGNRPAGNESSDDQGFMNKLAYWCNKNESLMRCAFLDSPYSAGKDAAHRMKCARPDYIARTIQASLIGTKVTAREKDEGYKLDQTRKDFHPLHTQDQKNEVRSIADGYAAVEPLVFETITGNELLTQDFGKLKFIVKDFVHQGLALLAAPSKYGKSWFVLDMCVSVTTGTPFLMFGTNQSSVLYLALEDSFRRAQDRLRKVHNNRGNLGNFHVAIRAKTLDTGLEKQIDNHMKDYPDTSMIVIDILQKVRSSGNRGGKNAYEWDTEELGRLKSLADKYNICIFALHHMTKWKDPNDPFNSFSGSAGIQGAIDQGFALAREERTSEETTLHTIGRELGDEKYILQFNKSSFRWQITGTAEDQEEKREHQEYTDNPVVKTIKGLLNESPIGVEITASDFMLAMPKYADTISTPEGLGKAFKKLSYNLFRYDKIIYRPGDSKKRKHSFAWHYHLYPHQKPATPATSASTATPATPATSEKKEE